jgi:small-conductance mechanosensitive channel
MILAVSTAEQTAVCGPADQASWLCTQTYRITGNKGAAEVADALATPLRIALVLLTAWIVTRVLRKVVEHLVERIRDYGSLATFAATARIPVSDIAKVRRAQRAATVSSVLRNVVSIVVWTIAVVIVLTELGINIAPIIAGAGIAGIAIGFGTQSIVRDYMSGLFVVLEDQYGVGDQVQTVVSNNQAINGTVEWVSLRMTRLRGSDGVTWYVPNGEIRSLGNLSQRQSSIGEPDARRDDPPRLDAGPAAGRDADGGDGVDR